MVIVAAKPADFKEIFQANSLDKIFAIGSTAPQ